ncbi:MAG: hypothetical protein WCP70_05320 [Methanothrix sp.]
MASVSKNPAPWKTALTGGQHTWLSGPTGPPSPRQASQPALTTTPPRPARPTNGGHERSRSPSGAERGPAAARRCCRKSSDRKDGGPPRISLWFGP